MKSDHQSAFGGKVGVPCRISSSGKVDLDYNKDDMCLWETYCQFERSIPMIALKDI